MTAAGGAATRPVLCIINQSDAGLGGFKPALRELGLPVREVAAVDLDGRTLLDEVAGIVSLGGEMGAHESARYPFLARETALLAAAHERDLPILGVCLGGQLLADALGARVYAGRGREVGWLDVSVVVDDPVLGPRGRRRQFQWHSDSFDVPPGAELVATSPACAHQAFRLRSSYGLQFHPEVTVGMLREWSVSAPARAELREAGVEPDELTREAAALESSLRDQARTMMSAFAAMIRAAG